MKQHRLGLSFALLTAMAGCNDGDDLYTANVPYQLGAGLNCQDAKITTVRAVLGQAREQVFEQACDDTGVLVMQGVPKGRWPLVVEGVDHAGAVTMSSTGVGPIPTVEIVADGVSTPKMTLASLPAKIEMRWDLGFGDCASLNLASFAISAWDDTQTNQLAALSVECTAPQIANMYRSVPDPDGRIVGADLQSLTIQPQDSTGQPMGDMVRVDLPAPPGPGYIVRVSLKCDAQTGCSSVGPAEVAAQ